MPAKVKYSFSNRGWAAYIRKPANPTWSAETSSKRIITKH